MKKDNKTWNWCIHCLAWCLHTSNDCRKGTDMTKQTFARSPPLHDESNSGQPKSLLAHLAELSIHDE
jgi:hypothetical protein